MEKLPIFSFRHILKDVFKTLLWGPETVRKKYRVGSEIFPKRVFFCSQEKKLRNFFIGKISDFSNSEHSKRCLQDSSVGSRNNQEKILSSFGNISEKVVFFDIKMGFRVPSTTIRTIKKYEVSKKPILGSNLKVKNFFLGEI